MTLTENAIGRGIFERVLGGSTARVAKEALDFGVREACGALKKKGWIGDGIVEALTVPYAALAEKYRERKLSDSEERALYPTLTGYHLRERVRVRYLALKSAMDDEVWREESGALGFTFQHVSEGDGSRVEVVSVTGSLFGVVVSAVLEQEGRGRPCGEVARELAEVIPHISRLDSKTK